jgi:hypothetical protein
MALVSDGYAGIPPVARIARPKAIFTIPQPSKARKTGTGEKRALSSNC